MSTIDIIQKRKSVRNYSSKVVEGDKLESIVKVGKLAPRHGKLHLTVVQNQEILKEASSLTLNMMKHSGNDFLMSRAAIPGYDPIYGANTLVLISSPEGNDENGYNMANASCSAENMLIAATDQGLGSCFVMSTNWAFSTTDLTKKAGIPEGYKPLCGVLLGYADGPTDNKSLASDEVTVNYCK